jgi:hypothetical protein
MKDYAIKLSLIVSRLTLGLLVILSLLTVIMVGFEANAVAKQRNNGSTAKRARGRTLLKNLRSPVMVPREKSQSVSMLFRGLGADFRRNHMRSRRVLRRMLRSRHRVTRVAALRYLLAQRRLTVSFAVVARLALSRRERLSTRRLAIRALLMEPAHRHPAGRLLLRLTHGGAQTARQVAYRFLNSLPPNSRTRCRRFAELIRRRGMPSASKRLVSVGFARNCLSFHPRAVLRAARNIRISVRLGIAEGLQNHSHAGRHILARLVRDAHRQVRLAALNAILQNLDVVSRHRLARKQDHPD